MANVVDAVAMRSFRRYDDSFYLAVPVSQATVIQIGDEIPDEPNVYISNGTIRPFILRATSTLHIPLNQNVTADLWVHCTGPIPNFQGEIHEHVDTHPNTGDIRRDFYKWKVQEIPGSLTKSFPAAGWHRYMLWQQRSNASTIMDFHTGGANRADGMADFNAEVSWVTP